MILFSIFCINYYQSHIYATASPLMDDGSSSQYYITSKTTYKDFTNSDIYCSTHFYSKVKIKNNRTSITLLEARVDNGLVGPSGYNLNASNFSVHFECTGFDPGGIYHYYQTDHIY